MKKVFFIAISMLMAFNLLNAADEKAVSTEKIKSIKITTIDGKQLEIIGTEEGFQIPQYKGKIVFAEFWGTHCPPCLMSIPHYIKLQEKYKDDLAILAIEVQNKPKDGLKEFVKAKGINYDIASYKDGYDFVGYITQRAGWSGSIPFLLILDQAGKVQIVQPGMIPVEQLEKVIQEMIKAYKSPKSAQNNASKTITPNAEATKPAKVVKPDTAKTEANSTK